MTGTLYRYVYLPKTLSKNKRVPDTVECFPWDDGSASVLETRFDDVTGSSGSVLVSRTGDASAISAYGYTYDIDFVGTAVRGDMDLRYSGQHRPREVMSLL